MVNKTAEQFSIEVGKLNLDTTKVSPVDTWNPKVVGEIDIIIDRDGDWLYQGARMERKELVKLFSTILRLDSDGFYYLVTPVEKLRIKVNIAPFSLVDFTVTNTDSGPVIIFKTNIGDEVPLSPDHPLTIDKKRDGEPVPFVLVRANLKGLLSRNAFYRLIDIAEVQSVEGADYLGVWSCGVFHKIDRFDG